jgi:hypothetical protein
MTNQTYTRKELENFGEGFPDKGLFCKKCKTFIPQFAELSEEDAQRVRNLSSTQPDLAMQELKYFTGFSERFAKIWVLHEGKPEVIYDYPCPYCGEQLRTSEAKQCRHCLRDWHDEIELKWLK